ncbi:endonuclease [Sphingomonas sp. DBB INV C78]|uniref:GIY-YIG nuclease family protein n=1 Tax=Sphingomonas sp. DBB INV C78 TaxID=3349434 RepID=UPI0036D2E57F
MIERQPCVYILASDLNGTLYVGVTSDLLHRIVEHREGKFDGFTKRYGIKRLVDWEHAGSMESAILREKQIKRWQRDWKRNLIERDNPSWDDLAVSFGLEGLTVSLA